MPEAPKEVVPEKKVPLAPPKKPEVPPAKGSHPPVSVFDIVRLSLLCLIIKILISLKYPRCQKQLSPKRRCLKLFLPNQKVLPLKVIMKLSKLVFFKKKNSLLDVINICLQNISYTLVNSGVKMSLCL